MTVVSSYIHALDGRLRVKVAELKGSRMKAVEVEGQLRSIAGITHVRVNLTTGNVLVLYDPASLGPSEILGALQRLGYLRGSGGPRLAARSYPPTLDGVGETFARTLMHTTMELAVRRLVSALI